MKLAGGSTASLNTNADVRKDTIQHLQLSDPNDSDKIHKTVTDYYSDRIVIHPDSLTGEFETDIILIDVIRVSSFFLFLHQQVWINLLGYLSKSQ